SFIVNSDTQITAVAPAHAARLVDVTVTSPGGTSSITEPDGYIFISAPVVASVSPANGPISGSTSVILTGTDFSGASAVSFGGTPATSFSVDSPTQITAVAPAHS